MTDKASKDQVKIGLIATGDELTCGDILNTNGQKIAKKLHELGFALPFHLVVDDQEANIVSAINFLFSQVDVIFLLGGLGPTSDDRTRFALSEAIAKPLVLDEENWQLLQQRLANININITENNQQQALFPAEAIILDNPNGTAAGCYYEHKQQKIFMLPGPPAECLPMFNHYVLPLLESLAVPKAKSKWLLLGAREGEIASLLDNAVGKLAKTGYRWNYPYLEYKLFTDTEEQLQRAMHVSKEITGPFFISDNDKPASQLLMEYLYANKVKLALIPSPLIEVFRHSFSPQQISLLFSEQGSVNLGLSGFLEFWQQVDLPCHSSCQLNIDCDDKALNETIPLYYRSEQVTEHLREIVCKQLLIFFGVL
jgi:molybdenum cofactor synthesis domain-containing protein